MKTNFGDKSLLEKTGILVRQWAAHDLTMLKHCAGLFRAAAGSVEHLPPDLIKKVEDKTHLPLAAIKKLPALCDRAAAALGDAAEHVKGGYRIEALESAHAWLDRGVAAVNDFLTPANIRRGVDGVREVASILRHPSPGTGLAPAASPA